MYRNKKVALIVVAHNEERLIKPTLEKARDFLDTIIVIDDASKDNTAGVVNERKKLDPRIQLHTLNPNQGVGGAVVEGYLKARDQGYDIAVVVGGDDQMPMEQMERLLDPIVDDKCDYAKGNRFLEGSGPFETMPRIRLVGNTIISMLCKIASGYYKIFDVVDGYTAMNRKALERIDWSKAWRYYGYPMDFLIRLNAHGMRVLDVPRRAIYLPGERQSQIKGFRYALKVSPMLFRRFLWRLQYRYVYRDFHPLVFCWIAGALSLLTGVILGLWIISAKLRGTIPSAATSVLCSIFVSLGFQGIFFAMLFEMLEDQKR
jgi:glycosyltransferase involved in cell wall biosynthesis